MRQALADHLFWLQRRARARNTVNTTDLSDWGATRGVVVVGGHDGALHQKRARVGVRVRVRPH